MTQPDESAADKPEEANEAREPEKPEEYSAAQRYRISTVYQMLAQAIPTEGRDYAVKFDFPKGAEGETISVSFETYNELGRIWCDYCRKALQSGALT